ncbi:MAG: MFS transporter [Alphaproteobacteria bacterium]|nr:MFS transporter [Alphaproteobacteria bacterium]
MTSVLAKDVTQKARKDSLLSDVRAWFIWSFAGLFYMYQFILRNSPGVMTDDLMRDFSVEACSLGILSSFYLVSYVSLQIPVGLGMDKFGPTRLLKGAILLCMIGTIVFAISDSFYLACFGRLLIGAGSTCAFLGSLKLATNWFHAERLALVVGFTLLAGKLGASFGQAPLAFVIDALGWREALLYVVVPIGFLIGAGIWIFVKDTPPEGPIEPVKSVDTSLKTLFSRLKDFVIDYRIWALGFYGALMYVPMLAFVDLWGIPFLMKLYDIDRVTAGSVTTMFYVGAGIGSPLVALISDYLMNRKLPMAVGAILAIICNIAIIYLVDVPLIVMYMLFILSGFFFAAQPLIFSSVCQLTPHGSNGTAVSFTNMIVMIVGMVLQPLIGWFLDWIWDGVMNNGIPLYTIADYRFAFLSVPICLLISLLLVPLIPETFPREKKVAE